MRLHENKRLFEQAVRFTSQRLSILDIYVEKDYWVTYALFQIFSHEIGEDVVFKGGTALSKCYGEIERFSEDIDLVVLRREGETDNKLKRKLKDISLVVAGTLPEVPIDNVTRKMGMNRKTAHTYSKQFRGDYGQVRDAIILESSWLGYYEPYTTSNINSLIGSMMKSAQQFDLIEEYNMNEFQVRVLEPIRTICEKVMSSVRFSYEREPLVALKKKVRHTYDLHQLLQLEEFSSFVNSPAFDDMLLKVAQDDVKSFRNNNQWLVHHPKDAYFFSKIDEVFIELSSVYIEEFRPLVYGQLPEIESIKNSMLFLRSRIRRIKWTIKL